MISVTNDKDLELDRNFDLVADEPLERPEGSDDNSSDNHVHREAVGASEELENRASESDFVSRVLIGNGKITESTESDETRVLVVDGKGIYEDMKPGDSDFRNKDLGQVLNGCKRGDKSRGSSLQCSRVENGEFDSEGNGIVELSSRASVHKLHVSTFDDFMTNGRAKAKGTGFAGSTSVGYGYEIGDMIWGKVKSHPWWPGVIYNDSFASPSVRRTKREGHVFVAFFGDGSYGWFEPAELIPFDTNFSEKSRQTNSRTFVKAVEDAVDEVSRRSGLGLACRCRNPYNFRLTNALGYFAVDLNNYEVGGVYSIGQIRKARASFQPRDTVAFMKHLALMARDEVYTSTYFFNHKATVLAYRKAVFEEFDETYAQAFGQQPVRPSRKSLEAVAHPVKVPLSGPMVVAEALSNRRRKSAKSHKSKEQENKEKYLFKRRDESSELKIHQTGQGTFSKQQPGYVEGSAALSVGDSALQKEADGNIAEPPFAFAESSRCQAPNSSLANRKDPRLESKGGDANMNLRHDRQSATTSGLDEGLHQPPNLPATDEEGKNVSPKIDPKVRGQDPKVHVDTGKKTAKLLKRPVGELGVEKSAQGEKKMKKKIEIESGIEMPSDHSQKQAAPGKDGPSSLLLPDSIRKQSTFGMGDIKHKLPQLLDDLQALALNPFHGVDSNTPSTVQMAFMKFRSAVFEKSFSSTETESNEANAPKLQADSCIGFELQPRENTKDLSPPKQPKRLIRPDDPTKGGRKRAPSDRQEEMASKRLKKVEDLNSLAVEKKAPQNTPETHRDGKEAIAIRPPKLLKPDSIKKTTDSSSTAWVPTMLIMKFPLNTNLPSRSELKARLARFGPLDHSATRVFWHSFTCRVVFLHKSDAEAAHMHLIGSNSLFGNVNVRSSIRALGATGSEPESKVQREDVVEQKPLKRQPLVQLKSCLRKVVGEEVVMGAATTGGNGGGRGTPHVKFVLEEGESSGGRGGEHLIVGNRNYNNTSSFSDGGGKSSSHGMEFNSRNFQKDILPLPSVTAKLRNTSNDMGYGEVAPRNIHNFNANMGRVVPSPTNIDIAQQMLGLLTKCNDLVANVTSFLGYVPYHPL